MSRLRDLVSGPALGGLRNAEMRDPTITVTNLGDRGVESVLGVIYPPQVALVGFGKRGRPSTGGRRHARRATCCHRHAGR